MQLAYLTLWEAGYLSPSANPKEQVKQVPKRGHCKHCGKKIGKGIRKHQRECKKNDNARSS